MRKLRITIGNKSYEVTVEDLTEDPSHAPHVAPGPIASAPVTPPKPSSQTQSAQSPKPPLPIASGAVVSPMPGAVKSILVKEADHVKQGQPLVILEAMKMENQITAPAAGVVKSVNVKEGDAVQDGHVLLVLE